MTLKASKVMRKVRYSSATTKLDESYPNVGVIKIKDNYLQLNSKAFEMLGFDEENNQETRLLLAKGYDQDENLVVVAKTADGSVDNTIHHGSYRTTVMYPMKRRTMNKRYVRILNEHFGKQTNLLFLVNIGNDTDTMKVWGISDKDPNMSAEADTNNDTNDNDKS